MEAHRARKLTRMTTPKRLELDPHGDIELILESPNAQTLRWPADTPASEKRTLEETTSQPPAVKKVSLDPRTRIEPETESGLGNEPAAKPDELRMLVSSRQLCLASSTFRKMLSGSWHEASSTDTTVREVRATEWDASALLIVLDIIHGHLVTVPKSVDLELLATIAAIVDYYDCHEITEPHIDAWIRQLQGDLPSLYGKQCMLWMSISWVFLRVDILREMTRLAVRGCQRPIETMSLPVPDVLSRKYMVLFVGNHLPFPLLSLRFNKSET